MSKMDKPNNYKTMKELEAEYNVSKEMAKGVFGKKEPEEIKSNENGIQHSEIKRSFKYLKLQKRSKWCCMF